MASHLAHIPRDFFIPYASLFSGNYCKLFAEIQKLLNTWNSLLISFFGQISAIKMSILPKLMYLFETLSIPIPKRDLLALHASILHFIWAQKRHRISNALPPPFRIPRCPG